MANCGPWPIGCAGLHSEIRTLATSCPCIVTLTLHRWTRTRAAHLPLAVTNGKERLPSLQLSGTDDYTLRLGFGAWQ